jgi:hypothetical protein
MRTATLCLLLSAVALCAVGCQEKFTRPRYETIYIGQPAAQVERTLGQPEAKFSDTWTYIHETPFYKAIIKFENSRVVDKAWYDSEQFGTHPDLKHPDERPGAQEMHQEAVVE